MNPLTDFLQPIPLNFPRASGDEPGETPQEERKTKFSPREWG